MPPSKMLMGSLLRDDRPRWAEPPAPPAPTTTKSRHPISSEEYGAMLADQGGGCALCGCTNKSGRALLIDHDHASGVVRGLLCANCNTALGYFADDPDVLRAAADYVERAYLFDGLLRCAAP